MERRVAIQVLYDRLRDKSKIHTGQRVIKVEHVGEKVTLQTKSGRAFEADIAVGADGIHSTLRREMWTAAEMSGATCFNDDNETRKSTLSLCLLQLHHC
jgi:2-polyprenyl-6-methoxyphenol hydroxylase-like FAD-dependent oxidoreductase